MLVAALGLAVDYTAATGQARKLQGVADIAALTAAREMQLANTDPTQITSVANNVVQSQYTVTGGTPREPVSVQAQVIGDGSSVEVVVEQPRAAYFMQALMGSLGPVSARAVARIMGGGRVCVIGLDDRAADTVILKASSTINAAECGVFSNSTNTSGLAVLVSSLLTADLICSAGGYNGTAANFSTNPLTDCPPVPDPLASRPPPTYGGCDYTNHTVSAGNVVVSPGVYCGGLRIEGNSIVQFSPGVYIIKDGLLTITNHAQATGEYVGFYFVGDVSRFEFTPNTSISLSAPRDGEMAGVLFYEDRAAPALRPFEIGSNDARTLVGTIYLPNGELLIRASNPVAVDSAYTAIVARRLNLRERASLTINSDYQLTDVPVPSGLGDTTTGGNVVLVK